MKSERLSVADLTLRFELLCRFVEDTAANIALVPVLIARFQHKPGWISDTGQMGRRG